MQIIEAVSIARYKSSEHLEIESRLLISESDRAVKESPSKMIEIDGALKVLVHLDLAERRCIPSFDRHEGWIKPVACVIPHFPGVDAAYTHSRAEVVPVHLSAMLEQPVLRKTSGVRLRQVNDLIIHRLTSR